MSDNGPGFISEEGLRQALRDSRREGRDLCELLRERAGAEEGEVLAYFAAQTGLDFLADIRGESIDESFLARVPVGFARGHALAALASENGVLKVATASPLDHRAIDDVARLLGKPVRPVLAPRSQILDLLEAGYGERMRRGERIEEDVDDVGELAAQSAALAESEDLLELTRKPPVVRLVNRIFLQALERRASDVHFQPARESLQVRLRVDGVLHDLAELPRAIQWAVVSRIKVMGQMDIAERRLAQDGRSSVTLGDRDVDLRISSLPTAYGEQVVVRILDRASRLLTLRELGMGEEAARAFEAMIHSSHGIVLVTGPTGSGKSTTLYAALQELDARALHIVTLEDPIEYRLEGVSQTQVNYRKGVTFASGLRNVLRQDPDIIMVGEIRDLETARMAVQSALTGHLVFSTLHTNDAPSAATRLLDLGIEPYLVNSALVGVLAQRLVRTVCPSCGAPAEPDSALARLAGVAEHGGGFRTGAGCPDCLDTGYRGRTGVFELLRVDERVREWTASRRRASEMKAELVGEGWKTMRADGVGKAAAGTTTLEEVFRVTQEDVG